MIQRKATALSHHDLWNQWKKDRLRTAKQSLIEQYVPLVEFVVNRFMKNMPRNVSRDDLIGYGTIGLIDAIDKFDHERGLQFETYASWRIRGAIIDGLRQVDWVPRSVREKAKTVEEAYQKLEQTYLRSVTEAEISEYLNLSAEEFRQMMQDISFTSVTSFDDPIREEEAETRLSLIVDEKAKNPESTVNEFFLKEQLAKAIDKLTEKERTVVSLFYYEQLSLSEIAEVMSLSPSRISQLHSKAIMRLRGSLGRWKQQLMQP
jgi:RNA polymerase sigma factor for flagellar operon FliA